MTSEDSILFTWWSFFNDSLGGKDQPLESSLSWFRSWIIPCWVWCWIIHLMHDRRVSALRAKKCFLVNRALIGVSKVERWWIFKLGVIFWLQHENGAFSLFPGQVSFVFTANWFFHWFRLAKEIILKICDIFQVQLILFLKITATYIKLNLRIMLCIQFDVVFIVVVWCLVNLCYVSRWWAYTGWSSPTENISNQRRLIRMVALSKLETLLAHTCFI